MSNTNSKEVICEQCGFITLENSYAQRNHECQGDDGQNFIGSWSEV